MFCFACGLVALIVGISGLDSSKTEICVAMCLVGIFLMIVGYVKADKKGE